MSAKLWHQRLGHVNADSLRKAVQTGALRGIKISPGSFTKMKLNGPCDTCQLSKSKRQPFPKMTRWTPVGVFVYIYSDLQGPFPESRFGNKYVITFVCANTRFAFTRFMKTKSSEEVLKVFKNFILNELPQLIKGWPTKVYIFFTDWQWAQKLGTTIVLPRNWRYS